MNSHQKLDLDVYYITSVVVDSLAMNLIGLIIGHYPSKRKIQHIWFQKCMEMKAT